MNQICLIGPVDKRAISYPLIKTLMFLGKTLIVTDDGIYRRFDEDYGSRFSFENSEFIIAPVITEEILQEVKGLASSYENILYITTNELPSGVDKVLYCRGVDKGVVTESTLKALENTDHTEVYVTFSKLTDNSLLKIQPTKSALDYIMECEDRKSFLATKDSAFATMLDKFFSQELDIPKASIKGLLLRKG